MSNNMSVKKDLVCSFNMPRKVDSWFSDGEEVAQNLPPYAVQTVYPVDEYPGCPSTWMHGSDMASSYFVGVEEDHGMWLDFNQCTRHTHDVAIVISIQGVNPITGQKMVGKKPLRLEKYKKKCPVHKVNFKQDRFCEKCGFKWPGQNYICNTGTPYGGLWLDGFRAPDGKIRQYIFTSEEMRGIAAQLIGKERVFAIGVAFYLSKEKKPQPKPAPTRGAYNDLISNNTFEGTLDCLSVDDMDMSSNLKSLGSHPPFIGYVGGACGQSVGGAYGKGVSSSGCSSSPSSSVSSSSNTSAKFKMKKGNVAPQAASNVRKITPVKQLEIGAGALIKQDIYDDPKKIGHWDKEPAGMIYINYCDQATLKKILKAGKREEKKEGFMEDLKVGS